MKLENFPRIDPDLVKVLEQLYPPLLYDPELKTTEFIRRCAFRAGQIEVISKLKAVIIKQKEGG